ncbi:MAG: hypothetical protein ABI921_10730 [Panacibacter sp.]
MKQSILSLLICATLFSCTKETILPTQTQAVVASVSQENETAAQQVVTFNSSVGGTKYVTQGLNTLQTDSFSVTGGNVYISKFVFLTTGTPNLSKFKFYINGGEVKATITYFNDTVTVALRKAFMAVPGEYNYILQAKTFGTPGSAFTISLNSAIIVDSKRFSVEIVNLPGVSDSLILR